MAKKEPLVLFSPPIVHIPSPVSSNNLDHSFLFTEPLCTSSQVPVDICALPPSLLPIPTTDNNNSTVKPITAASFLLTSDVCLEPPYFYDGDNISFFTSFINQPVHSTATTNATVPIAIPTELISKPEFNNTFNLIEELCQLPLDTLIPSCSVPFVADVSMQLTTKPTDTLIVQPASNNIDLFHFIDSPLSPCYQPPNQQKKIDNLNAPFTSYPRIEPHYVYPPDYVKPCRKCNNKIDFNALLSIPNHLPKGQQIMCAPCLLSFISKPSDFNVDYFYRSLF
jgi:hypothetical protein